MLAERFGMLLPEHYGDSAREYAAVRRGAGLLDLSFRGILTLTGSERLRWLNGQITNEVKALRAGEGNLAAVLTAKGHILADLAVYGLADAVWVDLPRDRAETVRTAFDRYIIADDVAVADESERLAHLLLAGPGARRCLEVAAKGALPDLAAWHHAEVRLGEAAVRVVASRWLRLPGYDLLAPAAQAADVWEVLRGAGTDLRPVGMAALGWLRLEAGWPWYGLDFDESNLLMESLTPEHVSFTKGCYIGQEVVIRVEHQGHVNRRLSGLVLAGEGVPPRGSEILSGDKKVGSVTSAVRSPALDRVIALGYVRRGYWEPGTRLQVGVGAESREAEVVPLPFVIADGPGGPGEG